MVTRITTKDELLFNLRKFDPREHSGRVVMFISAPDLPKPEKIINPVENFRAKADYYERAYDDTLQLIANPKIKISLVRFEVAPLYPKLDD